MNSVAAPTARTPRAAIAHGSTVDEARETKHTFLQVIYRILAIHLGTPPTTFDWQWLDQDRTFHRDGTLTPQEFAARSITLPLDEYVCLVHDPRETSPYGRTFTVDYLCAAGLGSDGLARRNLQSITSAGDSLIPRGPAGLHA